MSSSLFSSSVDPTACQTLDFTDSSHCETSHQKCQVSLKTILSQIDYPTVITTAILPGDSQESLIVATLPGKIHSVTEQGARLLLDIESHVLSVSSLPMAHQERGLVGLAFHGNFSENGLIYLYYSKRTSSHRKPVPVLPVNPNNVASLDQVWENREIHYDHICTLEEWKVVNNGHQVKCIYKSTLFQVRMPFANHLGRNNLAWSPESQTLILLVGDGGYAYDPFNLAQKDSEFLGKMYSIDVDSIPKYDYTNAIVFSKFSDIHCDQLPFISRIAKGICNGGSIVYERTDTWITYVTLIGQDNSESAVAFSDWNINFGWRAWEGYQPTVSIQTANRYKCNQNPDAILLINTDSFDITGEGYDMTLDTGSSISFYSNDGQPHSLVQTDSDWHPLQTKQKNLVPPSNPLCATLQFNYPGNYYLISTINKDPEVVRIKITVIANDSSCISDSEYQEQNIKVNLPCYYNEIITFPQEIKSTADYYRPFMCYNHRNFESSCGGSMIASAVLYKGNELKGFKDHFIFADLSQPLIGGNHLGIGNLYSVYLDPHNLQKLHEPCLIDISDRYENPGYFVTLGTNADKSRLFLGTFSETTLGKIYEIVSTKCGYSTTGYYNPHDYIQCTSTLSTRSSISSSDDCTVTVSCVDFTHRPSSRSCETTTRCDTLSLSTENYTC